MCAVVSTQADQSDFPDADPFTSMMSLDVEKELGITFDRARLHSKLMLSRGRHKADETVVYGMSKEYVQSISNAIAS